MARREAFKLKKPLFLWNAFLACFSILATRRGMPELVHALGKCADQWLLIIMGKSGLKKCFLFGQATSAGTTLSVTPKS